MLNRFENLQREFPDFDVATLPAIPAAWNCTAWRNETCPSFQDTKTGLFIFVDYADTAAREFPDGERFSVICVNDDNGEAETVHTSDNWDSVLAFVALYQSAPLAADIGDKIRLAREFGTLVQETLSRNEFRDVIDRNKALLGDDPVCHSHDFTDANMLMLQAFETVFSRKPSFLENAADESDIRLWNDAWQIAKVADFFA